MTLKAPSMNWSWMKCCEMAMKMVSWKDFSDNFSTFGWIRLVSRYEMDQKYVLGIGPKVRAD